MTSNPISEPIVPIDVAIIGGGIAGITAAIWCNRVGLSAVLFEKSERIGGQIHLIKGTIPDYPGFSGTPRELFDRLVAQLETLPVSSHLNTEVLNINGDDGTVRTADGVYRARAVLWCAGLRQKRHPCDDGSDDKIHYHAGDRIESLRDKEVLIVGSGDGAFENGCRLAGSARRITIAFRSKTPKARKQYTETAQKHDRIELLRETEWSAITGNGERRTVTLNTPGGTIQKTVDAVIVKIGYEPVTEPLHDQCSLSEEGYVFVDRHQKSDAKRLWAAGDVCNRDSPSLITAAGEACVAVKHIVTMLQEK